jgi:tetratricopeptide (TPR) repeat protein
MSRSFFVFGLVVCLPFCRIQAADDAGQAGEKALREGRYTDAARVFEAAVREAEQLGKKDARLPQSLLNLARVRLKQGRYGEADRLCLRAQPLLEQIHGKEHVAIARCLNLRAEGYRFLGLTKDAEAVARRALALREKLLGKQHPETAESVDMLALLGKAHERIERDNALIYEAFSLTERSLAVREKALGKDHPDLVASLLALTARGESDEAVKHLQRGIGLVKKSYGDKHPDLAEGLTALAGVYSRQEKLAEAEQAQEQALAIWKESLGPTHPRLGVGLYRLGMIRLAQKRAAEAEPLFREALRLSFSGLTDEELCHYGNQARAADWGFNPERDEEMLLNREAYFTEMIRRRGKQVETFLEEGKPSRNLERLTALRRVQKKPDPLEVQVRGNYDREAIFPRLPHFAVALANVDKEETPVRFTEGGDYRSGRQARWRFEVRDGKGKLLAIEDSDIPGSMEGGGLFVEGTLKHEETWDTTLDMNRFAQPPPGDYVVRILYHDHQTIADLPHVFGLIVCRSEPIRLHVQPRVIDRTRQEREDAARWVAKLDDKATPLMLVGTEYGKHVHKLIPPDTPPGKLFTLGWKAVPTLLDELDREKITPGRRSWTLALLYSITGWNCPRGENGVLASYEYLEGRWQIMGGRNGRMSGGGTGFTSGGSSHGGKIDEAKQRSFAKRWQDFRDYIVVRER